MQCIIKNRIAMLFYISLVILTLQGCGNAPRIRRSENADKELVTLQMAKGHRNWPVRFYTVYKLQFDLKNPGSENVVIIPMEKIKVSWVEVAGSPAPGPQTFIDINQGVSGNLEYNREKKAVIIHLKDDTKAGWSIREFFGMSIFVG